MVAPCWLFLNDLYYDARIHEHQNSSFVILCVHFIPNLLLQRHVSKAFTTLSPLKIGNATFQELKLPAKSHLIAIHIESCVN